MPEFADCRRPLRFDQRFGVLQRIDKRLTVIGIQRGDRPQRANRRICVISGRFRIERRLRRGDIQPVLRCMCQHPADDLRRIAVSRLRLLHLLGADAEKMKAVAEKSVVRPVGRLRTDRHHRYIVYKKHNQRKDRQTEYAVRHDPVDPVGSGQSVLICALIRCFDDIRNAVIALIRNDLLRIVIELTLRSRNILFNMPENLLGEPELFDCLLIAFKELDCIPALLILRQIMHGSLLDMRDCMLNDTGEGMQRHLSAELCRLDCRLRRLHDAVALERRHFNDLAAEFLRKLIEIDFIAVFTDNVHHVDCHNNRNTDLNELCGQIEIAFEIRTVHNIQNDIGAFADQIIPRDDLLERIGRKRIDARQVGHDDAVMLAELSFLFLDRHACPVSDILIGTGQRIEQRGFAAVRITGKRNPDIRHMSQLLSC